MDNKYYKILGINTDCTNEELKEAYEKLRDKYLEERFLEGEKGNEAAKKLTDVETAYREIVFERQQNSNSADKNSLFYEIEKAIREGDLRSAQEKLDSFDERSSEWHYYQSVVFYKKNWINESKKQLEIAIQMDNDNQKYKDALSKLNEKVNNPNNVNNNWNKSGNFSSNESRSLNENPQLGGDSCLQWCCDMIMCNMLLNCCCHCN